MQKFLQALVAVAVLFGCAGVGAQSMGRPSSFNGLTWSFSTNVVNADRCTRLQLDLMGDLDNASALSMHGALNCPATNSSFGVVGSMYRVTTGAIQAAMFVGSNVYYVCSLNATTFSGPCTAYIGSTVSGSGSMSLF